MLSMKDLNNETIKTGWDPYEFKSNNPEAYYAFQANTLLQDCCTNDRLPFFDQKKEVPSNLLNRNIMKDVNKTVAECHSSLLGCSSNQYIFGAEAVRLGLSLDKTKNMTPLLVAAKNAYNNLDLPMAGEMNVAKEGHAVYMARGDKEFEDRMYKKEYGKARIDYQFMYNIDQFDERSRKKILEATKPEQVKHKEQVAQRKARMQKNWSDNLGKNKDLVIENIKQDLSKLNSEIPGLKVLYDTMLNHEIAQQCGMPVKKYGDKAILQETKNAIAEGLNKLSIEKRDNPNLDGMLLDLSYRANKTGNKLVSRDISFEEKHQRNEHLRAKENLRAVER